MTNDWRASPLFRIFVLISVLTFTILDTEAFTGPVVSVLDADTLEVLHRQNPERIRLSGIDCS
jgi:endonuclease YncB( thermonuclease family)